MRTRLKSKSLTSHFSEKLIGSVKYIEKMKIKEMFMNYDVSFL